MYETQDSTDIALTESFEYRFSQELPEPLDHWSLDDFEDLIPERGALS